MENLIGTILSDRYEILDQLGEGGMAVVFKAKDLLLGRYVAVKVLKEQVAKDEANLKSFQNEAKAIATFSHPNIVKIYDIGYERKYYYIVMEFLEGETLKDIIIREGKLEPIQAIFIMNEILKALSHSHEKNVIHRDIKPHNIIITNDGKIKVTDFGIARTTTSATLTYSGQMVGSVYYISPEQASGKKTTFASDIYSCGVLLYEMLTGEVPFKGDNPVSIALSHVQKKAVPITELNSKLPYELEAIVIKAMNKNPDERYSSAEDMRNQLLRVKRLIDSGKIKKRRIKWNKKTITIFSIIGLLILTSIAFFIPGVRNFFTGKVEIPDVTGMKYEDAVVILDDRGLTYKVDKNVHSSEYKEGYIISQSPEGHMSVNKKRDILLVVSLGPELLEVNDVVGMSEREAKSTLTNQGFKVKVEYDYTSNPNFPAGTVYKQSPSAYMKAEKNGEIIITVSKGNQPTYVSMPDLTGKSLSDAEGILESLGISIGNITNQKSSKYASGNVISQSIAKDKEVLQGDTVDLVVSNGPGPEYNSKLIEVQVSDIPGDHIISIIVNDANGQTEKYNQIHKPGDKVKVNVTYLGEATITVYQDNSIIFQTDVP